MVRLCLCDGDNSAIFAKICRKCFRHAICLVGDFVGFGLLLYLIVLKQRFEFSEMIFTSISISSCL